MINVVARDAPAAISAAVVDAPELGGAVVRITVVAVAGLDMKYQTANPATANPPTIKTVSVVPPTFFLRAIYKNFNANEYFPGSDSAIAANFSR